MRSDLTFLSYIVKGYSFSWTQCRYKRSRNSWNK